MSVDHLLPLHEALLARLADALCSAGPPSYEPSPAELQRLSLAVAERQRRLAEPRTAVERVAEPAVIVPRPPRRRRLNRQLPRAVGAVGAVALLATTVTAAAATTGAALPRPVRQVAYDIGVPGVESPKVTDVRQTLVRLERARSSHDDTAADTAEVKLGREYAKLSGSERQAAVNAAEEQGPPAVTALIDAAPLGVLVPGQPSPDPPAGAPRVDPGTAAEPPTTVPSDPPMMTPSQPPAIVTTDPPATTPPDPPSATPGAPPTTTPTDPATTAP